MLAVASLLLSGDLASASTFRDATTGAGTYVKTNVDQKTHTTWKPSQRSNRNGVDYIFDLQFGLRNDGSRCSNGYTGNTCTERVCAYGLSSSTSGFILDGDAVHTPSAWTWGSSGHSGGAHSYTECSSQGICDRVTGECACFAGYQGKGCRRTTCPNDCSGHGRCLSNRVINTQYVGTPSGDEAAASFGSQFWDADKTMQCACDRGYTGHDCSDRICPHGDDVLTSCSSESTKDKQVILLKDVMTAQSVVQASATGICGTGTSGSAGQPATLSPDSGNSFPPFFYLSFQDHLGGTYTTKPIQAQVTSYVTGASLYTKADQMPSHAANTAAAVQQALESLPNHVIPSVKVTGVTATAGGAIAKQDGNGHPVVDVVTSLTAATDKAAYAKAAKATAANAIAAITPRFADCVFKHLKLTVTFTDAANSGKQNTIGCHLASENSNCDAGMQPRMPLSKQQASSDYVSPTCVVIDEAYGVNGDLLDGTHEENEECGNRGLCDKSTGKCTCFSGHTGEACEIQSNFV